MADDKKRQAKRVAAQNGVYVAQCHAFREIIAETLT
jgi:hypothetical protein